MKSHAAEIMLKLVKEKERIIADNLPEKCEVADLTCTVLPNKVEIYAHKGIAFLEIHPFTVENVVGDGEYKMIFNQNYRVL